MHAALDDGEEGVLGFGFGLGAAVMGEGALGPADGKLHALAGAFVGGGVFGAFVEHHQDVAAESELDVDGRFRGEEVAVAVEMAGEFDALFVDFAQVTETEDLKAATVGEDGAGPVHEFVQAAEGLDGLVAGAEKEMVGVGEDDGRVDFFDQVARHDALDAGLGADGHEDGGFDDAVGGVETAGTGAGFGADGVDFELEGGQIIILRGRARGKAKATGSHSFAEFPSYALMHALRSRAGDALHIQ